MTKQILLLGLSCVVLAQEPAQPAADAVAAGPVRAEALDIRPLAPPDLDSPYASPRDAARHRLQTVLVELAANRDVKAALRGLAESFATDRSYAVAAFDLGVLSAVAGKWPEAMAALTEAARLDPSLRASVDPQLERLKLVQSLESTPDGKRQRRYEEALNPVLGKLPRLSQPEALAALVEVGRIDPKRWEAPALIAGLYGSRQSFDAAARFLEIAAGNAVDASVKATLETALRAAQRELRFAAAQTGADSASETGDYAKAAELYETAWREIPARPGNALNAASARLLEDDTTKAAAILARLRTSPDADLAKTALAMLECLKLIEPAAASPANERYFEDPGPAEPVRLDGLLPPIDQSRMRILDRPLPRLLEDRRPVVLLESMAAGAPPDTASVLPALSAPRFSADGFWRELSEKASLASKSPEAELTTADAAPEARAAKIVAVTSSPAGADVFLDERAESLCQTPCDIRVAPGQHSIRWALTGYEDEMRTQRVAAARVELSADLKPVRGQIAIAAATPMSLRINGAPVSTPLPAEFSLLPGLYRFGSGSTDVEDRYVNIKPGARLSLTFAENEK